MRSNKKSPNILYDVFIPQDKKLFPSCSCHSYCSYRLPCIHIARVYMDLIDRMYHNKHTIHPYWHVTYHPLFKEVKNKINGKTSIIGIGTIESFCQKANNRKETDLVGKRPPEEMSDILSQIDFPRKPNVRYSTLHGMTQQLIELAKDNASLYKITKLQLNQMINQAKCFMTSEVEDISLSQNEKGKIIGKNGDFIPLSPMKRKQRLLKDNFVNNADIFRNNFKQKKGELNHLV